jgi:single-strand DNA-binding protein
VPCPGFFGKVQAIIEGAKAARLIPLGGREAQEKVKMAGLNKVMIIGNLGRDPEMRYTPSGAPVTTFSVAVNRRWTSQDGQQQDETEWFNVVAWNKLAETCSQQLSKGRLVYVEGRLRTRSWDGQDGQKHYRTEIIASAVQFLDSARARGQDSAAASGVDDELGGDIEADDIPF